MGDRVLLAGACGVETVSFSLAVQEAQLPAKGQVRLRFRSGVKIDDLVVSGHGIYGDTVNLPARNEAMAWPGKGLVSATMADQARSKAGVVFVDRGVHRVENIPDPVVLFRARGKRRLNKPVGKATHPAMRIVRDFQFVTDPDRGASAAIGNFDGVHLGHRSVIEMARRAAPQAPLGVMTFEPHPREFFAPSAPPFRLMSREARRSRLAKLGVDILYELNFNAALSGLSPEQFAERVISRGLGLTHVVVGADFHFGKGRAGSAEDLVAFGAAMGFGVTVAPLLEASDKTVSSTAIRTALSEARPRDAAAMLGHWHRIEGVVIGGEQRGRELGYPTANMSIEGLHPPAFGVYAVLVEVRDGPHAGAYHGVASLGVRPMFGENRPNLETFLFDFTGDLYGATLSVGLVEFLRGEEKFDSLEALIAQMDDDSARARAILAAL